MRVACKAILALMLISYNLSASQPENILRIYHDADRSVNIESAISIERGVRTALHRAGYKSGGYKLEFVALNHRGNVLRSKRNFEKALADPNMLAVVSGIHSPPLIKNRDWINQNQILTLVPWAAGAPITRYADGENWIFRLSVDDARAGGFLADYAVRRAGCKAPVLALESTPWGDHNLRSIGSALAALNTPTRDPLRFGFNIQKSGSSILAARAAARNADCMILVANTAEGAAVTNAVADLAVSPPMKVISHWGITAGSFTAVVPQENLQKTDLQFIQSCFAFTNQPLSAFGAEIFSAAKDLWPEHIRSPRDILAPVGFIHGFDLTNILLAALNQIEPTDDIAQLRAKVRTALENIETPVQGLVKNYTRPFASFDAKSAPNAHDALGPESYCMAAFDDDGAIIVNRKQ